MTGRDVHRSVTAVLSLVMVAIGVALMVQAFVGHSGVITSRLLLGILFAAAGLGRLYVEARRGRRT
jgi:hypothetical protein